jgi:hypothetical protein
MGSRPRLVAEGFSKLPNALNRWEISYRPAAVAPVLMVLFY